MDGRYLSTALDDVQNYEQEILSSRNRRVLPSEQQLQSSINSLEEHISLRGSGLEQTTERLIREICPALNGSSLSPNYYGFVTGGMTPAARVADRLVTLYDQNVQVHLPNQTIATVVEERALSMLLELLDFSPAMWPSRTFTTGATASNVLGLTCGREFIIKKALMRARSDTPNAPTIGEDGILQACLAARITQFKVLTTMPHSSIWKAASVAGLGRSSVIDVSTGRQSLEFDMEKLEDHMKQKGTACIVVVSCGEVNTGLFATHSSQEVRRLRELCDKYDAWIHVDGAFGLFARILDPNNPSYASVRSGAESLDLADSLTGDAHKLLNVPYDCGFFFSRNADMNQAVFQNPNAAYLKSSAGPDSIVSPLNIRIENSSRFRGLPVYATLSAYGILGYRDMLERQVRLARAVAFYIQSHEEYELLPPCDDRQASIDLIFIIVLFRARKSELNVELVRRINSTSKIYVSGTMWDGRPASRIAISNWQVDVDRDLNIITAVLESVL